MGSADPHIKSLNCFIRNMYHITTHIVLPYYVTVKKTLIMLQTGQYSFTLLFPLMNIIPDSRKKYVTYWAQGEKL